MAELVYARAERCMHCRACEVACQRVHDGVTNVTVVRVEDRFAVPLMCRHCDPAPCVSACYAGALATDDGTVAFDGEHCTGCGLCLAACPFGVIGWAADGRTVHHCDLCADRLAAGQKPVCALTCPAEALRYEEYDDFVSRVQGQAAANLLRTGQLGVRR